jgi:hypothetical protein
LRLAGGELADCATSVRKFADIEAVLGLLQRLLEHANVALLNLDDGASRR